MSFLEEDDFFRTLAGDFRVLGDNYFRRAPGSGGPGGDPNIAPVASGSVSDQTFNRASGDRFIATAGAFTGYGMTFSISPVVQGVTIFGPTGVVKVETDAVIAGTEFTVTATNLGGSDTITFDIEVVAKAPTVIGAISDRVYDVSTGPYYINGASAISAEAATWTIEAGGSVASINSSTGLVTIAANAGAAETTVTVRATNSGGYAEVSFTVEVLVDAPAAVGSIPNRSYLENSGEKTINVAPYFSGDILEFTLTAGGSIASLVGNILTIPTDTVTAATAITVQAENSEGTATQTFTAAVTVAPPALSGVALAPIVATVGQSSVELDASVAFTGTNRTYSISPSGSVASINSSSGLITVSTVAQANGQDFTITASNAAGSIAYILPIRVNDIAPVRILSIPNQSLSQGGSAVVLDLTTYFDGENLVYQLLSGSSHATLNAVAETLTIATNPVTSGVSVVIQAQNTGGTASSTFTVVVGVAAPVISGTIPNQTITKGAASPSLNANSMISGANVIFAVVAGQSFASVDYQTGAITINTATAGSATVTIEGSNSAGSVQASFNVLIQIAAPVASGTIPNQSFNPNTGNQTVATAGYFTGEALTYSLTATGNGVTVNSSTGVVTVPTTLVFTPVTITVRATNSTGFASRSFTVEVKEVAAAARGPVGDIGIHGSVSTNGAIWICGDFEDEDIFWGDAATANDNGGTRGNIRVQVGGFTYYLMSPIDLTESTTPIGEVRGDGWGDGLWGSTFLWGARPADLDRVELDGSGCVSIVVDESLWGQTLPVTTTYFNDQGRMGSQHTTTITIKGGDEVVIDNAILSADSQFYLTDPDDDEVVLTY